MVFSSKYNTFEQILRFRFQGLLPRARLPAPFTLPLDSLAFLSTLRADPQSLQPRLLDPKHLRGTDPVDERLRSVGDGTLRQPASYAENITVTEASCVNYPGLVDKGATWTAEIDHFPMNVPPTSWISRIVIIIRLPHQLQMVS